MVKTILIAGAAVFAVGTIFVAWCCCRAAAMYDHEAEDNYYENE